MSRYARHLDRSGPTNPFPGLKALERKLGREVPHRLGSNEGLDMPHRALKARFGDAVAELARAYGDAEAMEVRQRLVSLLGTPLEALLESDPPRRLRERRPHPPPPPRCACRTPSIRFNR